MSAALEEELVDKGIDMEEDKGVDFQSLRARFQNDDTLKIRMKPAIPEKPKTLTSPTTKISNPLVSSINSAMEHHMSFTPRVVFKDEKKSTVKRQLSQPEALHPKVQDPRVNPESVDNKQKKDGILFKQALKDKNLPLVLPVNPVTPVIDETPKPDPGPDSPASASPSKASTPKRKSLFSFSKPAKAEKEKTEISKCTVPVSPALESLAPSNSTPISSTPIFNKVVAPKALVPPVQAEVVPPSSSPIPIIPEPEVLVPTVPEPDIVSQICPEVEILKPDVPVTHDITVTLPEPDDNLPFEMAHSPEIPDILDMDIPPPIIPEDDDADISALDILAPVTPDLPISALSASYTPVSSTPNHSRTGSPALSASASVTPEPSVNLVPQTVTPNSDAASSPRSSPTMPYAATDVKPVAENGTAESQEGVDPSEETPEVHSSTSSQPISALSVLARAEEMAPVRHNSCDQRVLNLLEKAKRKHNVNNQTPPPTTPETGEMISLDTTSPAFTTPEASTSENSQPEAAQAEPVPTVEAAPLPQTPAVDLPDIPPVDYEEQPVESNSPSSETALTNDHVNNRASPVPDVLVEQKPRAKAKPPPPPPRKTPVTIPNGSITSEKPTSTDLHNSTLPDQPVEENVIIIPAPVDFTSEDLMFNDSECDDPSEADALEDPQAKLPELQNSFLEQLGPEYQRSLETTETDFAQMASGVPDSVPDSPATSSPSGTLEMNYNDGNDIYEDLAANKKSKNAKKQRKVAPMNPYADSLAVNEDHSRKTLFAKKSASLDEKDLKKKEKQKEKEKEKERKEQKEKEKEKKEQKEKEKEKKEHKEKEKDKKEQKEKEHKEKEKEKKELKEKEHKEKEKEKKELKEKEHKEKEKEKKEQKDKEREKKEQKEKEREKKEQKEKEKKENEMRKKFKIKGDEEAMYQVRARETCKGRKNDLAVKAGETVSIIRTTDCPKGKWLARDSNNKYGYIPVESVELNVQEMMELGKKAKVSSRPNSSVFSDPDVTSTGSRSSNQYISNQESFSDDSEEWCDDDDAPFTPSESTDLDLNHISSPETVSPEADPAKQAQVDGDDNVQARHEALQKLATFFAKPKVPDHTTLNRNTIIEEPEPEEPESMGKQDVDLQILPPPDLYADLVVGDSEGIYCN